ncbi:MAG: ankyrin repeat domain-containing protein [Candidatus Amoebophilus sp.]
MLGKCSNTRKPAFQALLTIILLFIAINASSCGCDIFKPPANPHAVASQLKFAKLECDAAKGIVIYNIKNDAKEAATNIQLRYTNNSYNDAAKTVVINNKLTDTINIKTIPAGGSTGDQTLPIDFKLAAEATFKFEILCKNILHITPEPKTFYDKLPQLKLVTVGPTSLVGYDSKVEFKIQKEANSGNIDLSKLSLTLLYTTKKSPISDTKSIKSISGNELRNAVEGGNITFPLSHLKSLNVTQALLIVQLGYGDNQLDKAEFSWSLVLGDIITKVFMAAMQRNEEWMKELLKISGIDINIKDDEGETVLHKAVRLGSQEQVDFLLKFENINVNCKNKDQQTPLHEAVRYSNQEIIDRLLAKGADINAKDNLENTPLDIAAIEDNKETIQKLLSNSNIDINAKNRAGDTPFHTATRNKKLAAVQAFLQFKGIDINVVNYNGNTPLGIAARNGDVAIMKLLLNNHAAIRIDNDGNTLLHQAVKSGEKDAIKLLLDTQKFDVNAKNTNGETPLYIAITEGYKVEDIMLLLSCPGININNTNKNNITFLHLLVGNIKLDDIAVAIKAFLDKGADVNAKTKLMNHTPLHAAILSSNQPAVEVLLSQPVIELNAQTKQGHTPLHIALRSLDNEYNFAHKKEIVALLLKRGARTDIADNAGDTAVDLVKKLKNPELEQLFHIVP